MLGPDAVSRAVSCGVAGYLESYEHMGRAIVSCEGACTCAQSEIDAHSTAGRTGSSRRPGRPHPCAALTLGGASPVLVCAADAWRLALR